MSSAIWRVEIRCTPSSAASRIRILSPTSLKPVSRTRPRYLIDICDANKDVRGAGGALFTSVTATAVAVEGQPAGKQGIEVACGDGRVLRILELQAQGGRRMAAADYLRGHEIPVCL